MMKRAAVFSLIMVFMLIGTAYAVEVELFNETFTRSTGEPINVVRTFDIQELGGPAVIKLTNGNAEDSTIERVSSSIIKLNGAVVFDSSNFNQRVDFLEAPVNLLDSQNRLEVLLKSKPGGQINIRLIRNCQADAASVIGSEGGSLEVKDPSTGSSIVWVGIPEDTFTSDTILTITNIEDYPGQENGEIIGPVYDISISSEHLFNKDISICFNYEYLELTTEEIERLVLYYFDVPHGRWIYIPSSLDPNSMTICVHIDHLTLLGLGLSSEDGGSILGTVTGNDTEGGGLSNARVYLLKEDSEIFTFSDTNESGLYEFRGLLPGDYRLQFSAYEQGYIEEFHNDRVSMESADVISISGSETVIADAILQRGGTIAGVVTGSDTEGVGLADICVRLYDEMNNHIRPTSTSADGTYEFRGLAPGSYKILFEGQVKGYVYKWYENKESLDTADLITVTGLETQTANAELYRGGTIEGMVTGVNSIPLSNVAVLLLKDSWYGFDVFTMTDVNGKYSFENLDYGNYKLFFNPHDQSFGTPLNDSYSCQWHNGHQGFYEDKDIINPFALNVGETITIETSLSIGGTIQGKITDIDDTGSPIQGIWVVLLTSNIPSGAGAYVLSDRPIIKSDENGDYCIKGLPPRQYRMFFDAGETLYQNKWYQDKEDFLAADYIDISSDSTVTIDCQLKSDDGATISGTVADAQTGQPIWNCDVYIYNASSGAFLAQVQTGENGSYTVHKVPSGDVKIYFGESYCGYINEWHDNYQGWQSDIDKATIVNVQAPNETIVNAQLERGGGITGTVTSDNLAYPLSWFEVIIGTPDNVPCVRTTSDQSTYEARGLPTGQYKVAFTGGGMHEGELFECIWEFYNDTWPIDEAKLVDVTAPDMTLDINAQLTPGGTIAGCVTDTSGNGLPNRNVNVYDLAGNTTRAANTRVDGSYEILGLPTGTYKIRFGNLYDWMSIFYPEIPEWYDDQTTSDTAQEVPVTAPNRVEGINAVLETCGKLSGAVMNESGIGLGDITIKVYDTSGNERAQVTSLPDGTYSFNCLSSGSYKIHFDTGSFGYSAEWYENQPNYENANIVTLGEGENKTGIDAQLQEISSGSTFTNSIGMEFVLIPSGTFMMGSPTSEFERSSDEIQHEVTLTKSFYLQTTEVTQGQWFAIMGSNPSYHNDCGDDCPVETVSWNDCQLFINELNQREGTTKYRLPTEAEWEFACRAGTTTPFNTGNCLSTNEANYWGDIPYTGCPSGAYPFKTVPVKSFSPNAWGLYDMHGNVLEWCSDWYGDYPSSAVADPEGPSSDTFRVLRGGCWYYKAGLCRSAHRTGGMPDDRGNVSGFRIVRDF